MKHNINTYAANTTTNITEMTKTYNPNKTVKVRPSDTSWLATHTKKIIRKRKRLFDKLKKTKSDNDFNNYKSYRNKLKNEIRKSKKLQIDKSSDKLRNNTNGQKHWWKTLTTFIKPIQTSSITPLIVDGYIYYDSTDKVSKGAKIKNRYNQVTHLTQDTNGKVTNSQ